MRPLVVLQELEQLQIVWRQMPCTIHVGYSLHSSKGVMKGTIIGDLL